CELRRQQSPRRGIYRLDMCCTNASVSSGQGPESTVRFADPLVLDALQHVPANPETAIGNLAPSPFYQTRPRPPEAGIVPRSIGPERSLPREWAQSSPRPHVLVVRRIPRALTALIVGRGCHRGSGFHPLEYTRDGQSSQLH